jgi:hypothetical protein
MFGGAPNMSKKDFEENRSKVLKSLCNFAVLSVVLRAIPIALERI